MSSDTVPVRTEADVQSIPTIFDAKSCTRKGLCPVTRIKNGNPLESHSLYFEQHGSGPEKLLLIMGYVELLLRCIVRRFNDVHRLNSTSFAWFPQVDHFGKKPEYSVLVFDNRGVGNSDTPLGPYTYGSGYS